MTLTIKQDHAILIPEDKERENDRERQPYQKVRLQEIDKRLFFISDSPLADGAYSR